MTTPTVPEETAPSPDAAPAYLEAALAAAQAAVALDPYDMALRQDWLDGLRRLGRLGEAMDALELPADLAATPALGAARTLLLAAESMARRAGEADVSLDILERAVELSPDDEALLLRLLSRSEEAGRIERARTYGARLREVYARRLPRALAEGLEALRRPSASEPLPQPAIDWAWELAVKRDWAWEDWRAALDWGVRSRRLMREWWISAANPAEAITPLVDAPDLSILKASAENGVTGVLTGAHLGPTSAAVQIFQACGIPFRTIGSAGLDRPGRDRDTLIAVRDNRAATSRELVGEMKAGLIGMLADGPDLGDRVVLPFLGRQVGLSSLPSRLALKYGCPTYWCLPLWRGERIIVQLERLPDPEPGEAPAAFGERWRQAYLAHLEPVMRGDPRNFDLYKGVWKNAV